MSTCFAYGQTGSGKTHVCGLLFLIMIVTFDRLFIGAVQWCFQVPYFLYPCVCWSCALCENGYMYQTFHSLAVQTMHTSKSLRQSFSVATAAVAASGSAAVTSVVKSQLYYCSHSTDTFIHTFVWILHSYFHTKHYFKGHLSYWKLIEDEKYLDNAAYYNY